MNTRMQQKKSLQNTYLLWFAGCFGLLGLHRFYLNKNRTAKLWLFSFGLLGVGAVVDLLIIPRLVKRSNAILQLPILEKDLEKLKSLKNKFAKSQHFESAKWYREKEKLLVKKIEENKIHLK